MTGAQLYGSIVNWGIEPVDPTNQFSLFHLGSLKGTCWTYASPKGHQISGFLPVNSLVQVHG